jgi:hypothetical protein
MYVGMCVLLMSFENGTVKTSKHLQYQLLRVDQEIKVIDVGVLM